MTKVLPPCLVFQLLDRDYCKKTSISTKQEGSTSSDYNLEYIKKTKQAYFSDICFPLM